MSSSLSAYMHMTRASALRMMLRIRDTAAAAGFSRTDCASPAFLPSVRFKFMLYNLCLGGGGDGGEVRAARAVRYGLRERERERERGRKKTHLRPCPFDPCVHPPRTTHARTPGLISAWVEFGNVPEDAKIPDDAVTVETYLRF